MVTATEMSTPSRTHVARGSACNVRRSRARDRSRPSCACSRPWRLFAAFCGLLLLIVACWAARCRAAPRGAAPRRAAPLTRSSPAPQKHRRHAHLGTYGQQERSPVSSMNRRRSTAPSTNRRHRRTRRCQQRLPPAAHCPPQIRTREASLAMSDRER